MGGYNSKPTKGTLLPTNEAMTQGLLNPNNALNPILAPVKIVKLGKIIALVFSKSLSLMAIKVLNITIAITIGMMAINTIVDKEIRVIKNILNNHIIIRLN